MIEIAIIGTGSMASAHAEAFQALDHVVIKACCDLDEGRAQQFGDRFGISETYTDTDTLLESSGVDAVSIVTPDPTHASLALAALGKGVHVLCEKPLATSVADAKKMAAEASESGVVNMVNFSYRRSAALTAAERMISEGRLGQIMHFDAYYLQSWLISKAWGDWRTDETWLWRLSSGHGSGGVLGDVGVHILDFATHCIGDLDWLQCTLGTFNKAPGDQIGPYKLDANDSAIITCSLADGGLGTMRLSRWATGHLNSVGISVHGTDAALRINLDASEEVLEVCQGPNVDEAVWETHRYDQAPSIYERFVSAIEGEWSGEPDFERGAYIQTLLQASFESAERDCRIHLASH